MSRFLSFAFRVDNAQQARDKIKEYANLYHDARHVCWAYMIGPARTEYLSSDNGEPSGTAGKPILGQINSLNLTNVVVIVVRYFGGIKLGTPGLIAAYRETARLALDDAGTLEITRTRNIKVTVPYERLDAVMRIVKEKELAILEQQMEMNCVLIIQTPMLITDEIISRLEKINRLTFAVEE